MQVRTLNEKGCIKRSMIAGNVKFDYFTTLTGLSNEVIKSHFWKIDFNELDIEDGRANCHYRFAKVLTTCLDEDSLAIMGDYLKSNGFSFDNDENYYSLGIFDRCTHSNVVELIEPVLWWQKLPASTPCEEAYVLNELSLHFYIISFHCLSNFQEFKKIRKNIAINIAHTKSPIVLGVVHSSNNSKIARDEVEKKFNRPLEVSVLFG